MRPFLQNLRQRLGRAHTRILDWITFGRGGKPADYDAAYARAAEVANRVLFWLPFMVCIAAALPSDANNIGIYPNWFPNLTVMIFGFFALFQTSLYRNQLEVTHRIATEYFDAMNQQKDLVAMNRALEQLTASLISDNIYLMAENARLGGQPKPSGSTYGGMRH